MNYKDTARATLDQQAKAVIDLSHRIHAHPELAFAEVQAAGWIGELLAGAGFQVDQGICDLPTAFAATAGHGDLTIGICAEYDALPEVGHACGHNIIAAAAVGAGLALASVADELGIRVKVIGTPAEEGGGGKILLLGRGAFDDVDAAMMIHPCPEEDAAPVTLAVSHLEVSYEGKEAHASSYPEKGVNAADAITVAQVAIGLLRQHILASQRIHGIVTECGAAANIVPAHTKASYYVRAATLAELQGLEARVRACFQAGALATGCHLDIQSVSPPYSHFQHDREMVSIYRRNAEALGRTFPPEDEELLAWINRHGEHLLGATHHSTDAGHPLWRVGKSPAGVRPTLHRAICRPSSACRRSGDGLDKYRYGQRHRGARAPDRSWSLPAKVSLGAIVISAPEEGA